MRSPLVPGTFLALLLWIPAPPASGQAPAGGDPIDTTRSPLVPDSDQVEILLFEGGLALEEGRIEEAVDALRQALEMDPERLDSHLLYAEALTQGLRGGMFENPRETAAIALSHFNWVLEREPSNSNAENGAEFLMAAYLQDAVVPLQTENGRRHWEAGLEARDTGDWTRAVRELREAARMEPDVAMVHLALGEALLEVGRAGDAEKALGRALELDPENARARLALAQAYEDQKKPHRALDLYNQVLEQPMRAGAAAQRIRALLEPKPADKRSPFEQGLLGRAYLELGDPLAAPTLEAALARDPSLTNRRALGLAEFMRGNDARAIELLQSAREEDPADVETLYYLGAAHLRRGDVETGRGLLREGIQLDPRNPSLQKLLGLSLADDPNRAEEALRFLLSAHGSGARVDDFFCIVASLYMRVGRPYEARLAYENCAAERPDYAPAYYGLGVIADDRGDTRRAIEYLDKYVSLDEDPDRSAYFRLGVAYLRSGQDAKGFSTLRHIARPDSTGALPDSTQLTDLELLEATSYFLASARRFEDAIFIGEILLTRNPESAVYNNNLAMSYADANRETGRALALAQKANRLDSDNPGHLDTLGWTLARLGRFDEALSVLERSIALSKKAGIENLSEIYYHLGYVYRELSRDGEAREALTLALENPPTPFLRQEIQRVLDLVDTPSGDR